MFNGGVEGNWGSFECYINDKPVVMTVNLALSGVAPIKCFDRCVILGMYTDKVNEYGFPVKNEMDRFNDLEDILHEKLEEDKTIIPVGFYTTDGRKFFVYYSSQKNAEGIIANILKKSETNIKYTLQMLIEPNWDCYFNFLYPNEYEMHHISNFTLLNIFHEKGDDPKAAREVDHWAYFDNIPDAENAGNELEKEGYKVLEVTVTEDGRNLLHFSKCTDLLNMNDQTDILISIISAQNGFYDGWAASVTK